MRLSRKAIGLLVGVLVIVFAAGFLLGTRVGVHQFLISDAQYKASILSTEIKALKAGKLEPIIESMEINLDSELANHGRYMESNLSWLFPELIPKDDQAIRRAVAYRLENPYTGTDFSRSESWNPGIKMDDQFVRDIIEGQKLQKKFLRKTIEAYADKPHNPSLQGTPERRP